jgi:hypothetical protein
VATLDSMRAQKAARKVQVYAEELLDDVQFMEDVTELILAVQDDTELALMHGNVRFLGEPYMLYRALESVVGQERRPVHRAAAITAISDALSKYLGLKFTPGMKKRKRKELLPHV